MNRLLETIGISADRLARLRKEMAWVLAGQTIGFIGSFVGLKALTTIMGPRWYGQLVLGLTIAGVLNMYVYGPVANVVSRFFSVYRERKELPTYFAVFRRSHRVLAVIIAAVAVVTAMIVGLVDSWEWALIILLAPLFGVVGGINTSYLSLQSTIRQRKIVALHQGVDIWLRTGLAILFLVLFGASGAAALAGYLLGTLLVIFSQARFVRRNAEIAASWNGPTDAQGVTRCFREFARYAWSFVIFSGFAAVSMFADRWVIQWRFGNDEVGIYAAIAAIGNAPINLLFAMISQLTVPIVYERAGAMTTAAQARSSFGLVNVVALCSALVAAVACLVAFLVSRPAVAIFTSAPFVSHHSVLWMTAAGFSIFNVAQLFTLKGDAFGRPRMYLLPKALQALTFVVLAILFSGWFHIEGVALAGIVSSFMYLVAVLVVNAVTLKACCRGS